MAGSVKLRLFEELIITVNSDDWVFMYQNRFRTNTPSYEEIQAEFVSGTGITKNKRSLWSEADERFSDYISDLKEISFINLNEAARTLLSTDEEATTHSFI